MASSEDNISRIKTGASLLANGGTLTSEPCQKCGGVQVRLREKITCINCGNEVNISAYPTKGRTRQSGSSQKIDTLDIGTSLIEEKVVLIASEVRVENDISMQGQKAELLEKYLGILEKIKNLTA